MTDFWSLDVEQRRIAFEQGGAQKGWTPLSVEKDYWVYYALRHLFDMPELAGHATFKGGTSLSKAWGLIDRFSEDIDLTIGRDLLGFTGEKAPEHAQTTSKQNKLLKALRLAAGEYGDYTTLQPTTLEMMPTVDQYKAWHQDYLDMQPEMFSEEPPSFDVILSDIRQFQSDFKEQVSRQATEKDR